MEKRDNKSIISKFIRREVEVIYEKYRNIMEGEINLIAKFIRDLETNKVNFYDPYLEYGNTKALAEDLANEDNVDVIKLYIFLTSDLKLKLELEAVRKHYEDLKHKGYKQIDKYLLYYDYGEDILKSKAEDITVNIIDGKAEVNLSFAENEPSIQGSEITDSIRWIEGLNSFCFIQGNDPFDNEGNMEENKEVEDQMVENSHQEELYLRMLRYALDEYSFRNLGEFNCFDGHIINIINLYKGLLIDILLVEDIVVDGIEVSLGEYNLQIRIDDKKYILTPNNSFTKDDVIQ